MNLNLKQSGGGLSSMLCLISVGFTYRLDRLKPRASSSGGASGQGVYFLTLSIFHRPYTCCHSAL